MDLFDRDEYDENMRNAERLEWPDDDIFGEQIPGGDDDDPVTEGSAPSDDIDDDIMGAPADEDETV